MTSRIFLLLASILICAIATAQSDSQIVVTKEGFDTSVSAPAANFTGAVRIDSRFSAAEPGRVRGARVTFEPGARTAWHKHPLGQTLIITTGVGWVQHWNGAIQQVSPGDIVWIPPGVKHWHGATATDGMSHIAIGESLDGSSVEWLEQVSDEQYGGRGQELIDLSSKKWQWMADKDIDRLAALFHDRSKFVHMSGTWKKDAELEIIQSGSIWYKQADVHDVAVEVFDDTAIVWSRISLLAVVRGNEVSNEFTVTEVYQTSEHGWKLLDLTFSSVRDTHGIAH